MLRTASDPRRAGRYAEHRFRTGLEAWRRRRRNRFALIGAVLVGPAVGAYLRAPEPISSVALLIAGMYLGMLAFAWDSPPEFIDKWRRGAEGERRTAKTLRPLAKRGWTVMHDVPAKFGNHDHILVGPAGVFLLDSKNLNGDAALEDGVLTVTRPEDEDATYALPRLAGRVRGAAAELCRELRDLSGVSRLWVEAVVVVWPGVQDGPLTLERVTYVGGDHLVGWLAGRPQLLAEEQVGALALAARGRLDRAQRQD